jgi:DNA-binding winged helix-turn-helix (wHTH) protein
MLINNRFEVDILRNEVTDKQTGKLNHIEPRLMNLLCLLTEHKGKTVTREIIINKIWNDYPGADDGLNQAISVLRKFLNDNEKKIIETIPKKGYCFTGTIAVAQPLRKSKSVKSIYISAALTFLLIVAFILRQSNYQINKKNVSDKLSHEESIGVFKKDSEGNRNSKMNAAQRSIKKDRNLDSLGEVDAHRN